MSWGDGLHRWVSAFGELTSSIVAIPSPEQKVLRKLTGKALTARELASEAGLSLKEVYSTLGSLYERRAVSTHPSGYFWVGEIDLPMDRLFEFRSLRARAEDVEFSEVPALSA